MMRNRTLIDHRTLAFLVSIFLVTSSLHGAELKVKPQSFQSPFITAIADAIGDKSSMKDIENAISRVTSDVGALPILQQAASLIEEMIATIDNKDDWPKSGTLRHTTFYSSDEDQKEAIKASLSMVQKYLKNKEIVSKSPEDNDQITIFEVSSAFILQNIRDLITFLLELHKLKSALTLESDTIKTCPLCLDPCDEVGGSKAPSISFDCNHRYHIACLLPLIEKKKNDCPVCHKVFNSATARIIGLDTIPSTRELKLLFAMREALTPQIRAAKRSFIPQIIKDEPVLTAIGICCILYIYVIYSNLFNRPYV